MGGGITLLSVLTFFLPYQLLIPIHGVVQLVSNVSRTFYLRDNIKWDFVIPFVIGAPFGFFIAYFLLTKISNPEYYFLILALFILYTIFKPKNIPHIKLKTKGWFFLGATAGLQGSLLGAIGPLTAPFFLRDDISKEEVIGTKAFQQIFIHFLKIPLFLSLSFNYFEHADYLILLSFAAVTGTFIGVKLLKKMDEKLFKILFKTILFLAAIRLIYKFMVSL